MKINEVTLAQFALTLSAERKRQKLSREDMAAVCGVSASFIRDAESNPAKCSLGKLVRLINGLGLNLEVQGLEVPSLEVLQPNRSKSVQKRGVPSNDQSRPLGRIANAMHRQQADYGVPSTQQVGRVPDGRPDVLIASQGAHPSKSS